MNILVIDRDPLACKLISSRLEAAEHNVTVEPSKSNALNLIDNNNYDIIMVDPLPLSDARPVILNILKTIRNRYTPYIVLLSKTATQKEAIAAGANDILLKPLDPHEMEIKTKNAARLIAYCALLAGEDETHYSNGIIGRSAFNQLFLSAIDRSHRYEECSFVVFIKIDVGDKLKKSDVKKFQEKLSHTITYMRRQSDVVGQISSYEFTVLLQRPQYEEEPFDATNRFTKTIGKFLQNDDNQSLNITASLKMIELPLGMLHMDKVAPKESVSQSATAV